jgi:hypothetical protein
MKQEKQKEEHDKCKQKSNKILLQGRNENRIRL